MIMLWLWIMRFQALFLLGKSNIIPSNNVSKLVGSLTECIVQIARKHFTQDVPTAVLMPSNGFDIASSTNFTNSDADFILSSLYRRINNSFVIINYRNNFIEINHTKPGSYILVIAGHDALSLLDMSYYMLKSIRHQLNPSVTMLIVSINQNSLEQQYHMARSLLKMAWEGFIVSNAIVMIPLPTRRKVIFGIFNWIPQKQTDYCFKALKHIAFVDYWILGKEGFHLNGNLFPSKQITDMQGCILRADVGFYEPFAAVTTFDELWGIFYEALEIIKVALNVQIDYQRIDESSVADIILPVFYSETEKWFYKNTYPYYRDNLKRYVPSGLPIPRWKSLTKIFNPSMWIYVVITFILGSLTSWLLLKYSEKQNFQPVDLSLVIINTLLTYLSMGISNKYQGIMATIFFIIWLFYCLIINTAYQSALISFLADPGEYPPIKIIKDLQESDLNLMTSINFSHHFGEEFQVINSYQRWSFLNSDPNSIWKKRASALLTNEFRGKMYTKVSFNSERNRPRINSIDENVKSLFFSIGIFSHGQLLYEHIDKLMHRLFSSGIPQVWMDDVSAYLDRVYLPVGNDNQFVIIQLSHLQGAFYFWSFGMLIALVAFFIEIIFGNLQIN
ncbi:Ionotropic receptor 447 [Blattella germanica]|nr:Ionotropic receptor 447 [Blattella germanica]